MTKPNQSNYDKTQQLELERTQKLQLRQILKSRIMTKLRHSNSDRNIFWIKNVLVRATL